MKRALLFFALFCIQSSNGLFAQSDIAEDFYNTDKIQQIDISFAQNNWQYLLDSLRVNGDGLLLADVRINGVKYEYCGVRFRGSKSFQPEGKRNGLYIKLNHINKEQNIDGNKSIKLSNSLRDPSMVREVLSYEIARQYMPAPRANYAQITINGSPYALLVNVEPIADEFLDRNFGSSNGALYKAKGFDQYTNYPKTCLQNIFGSLAHETDVNCYFYNWEMKTDGGWGDLIELTRMLNEEPGKIQNVLDVDETLWMLAYNNVLVSLSSYSGQHSDNYYLYEDKFGKFHPIIWDMNLSFGSFKNTGSGSDLKLKQLQELDPLLHVNNPAKPLISKLLENERYKRVYLSHIRTILYDHFVDTTYQSRAQELQRLIQSAVMNDQSKLYTYDEFQASLTTTIGERSQIPGIVELMEKRASFLKKHPEIAIFPSDITDTKVLGRVQFSTQRIETFMVQTKVEKYPKRVYLMYRFNDDQEFREAVMMDDGNHNDGEANDNVYGITIVPQRGENELQYYIIAENATMVSYAPANYMWEQFQASLAELNK
ncbi:MAG: CotH kinase family protein [Saprospiraceae bacterium]|nr:CotH kinase family protein [Saprospiraceae bacterium]